MTQNNKFLNLLIYPVFICAISTLTVFSQQTPVEKSLTEIKQYLNNLETKGFSGSVLLVKDDKVLLKKGYGLADRKNNRAVTPETGFDIGSITKVFTSAAIFKLEQQGKLSVEDKISKYFKNAPPDKAGITIYQLITHTSGMVDLVKADGKTDNYSTDYDYEPVSREEIIRRAMLTKLRSEPGKERKYSNTCYSLLGAIIEMVSGKTYEQYVHDELFVPAGMKKTGYKIPQWEKQNLAVGYEKDKFWGTPLDHLWLADGPSWNLRANGGMLSTVDELYLWVKALEGDKILPKEAKEKFFAAMSVVPNARGVRVMGPAGGNGIFNAVYLWVLDENRVLVVMTNSDKFPAEYYIGRLAGMMLKSGL